MLHVILVHFNPRRLRVRTRLFQEAAARFEAAGAVVWRVEAAFADRDHEVTDPEHPRHIRVRTDEEIWNKEALINIAANRILADGRDVRGIAWVDADVEFVRPHWVRHTLLELDHHPVVQLFSDAIDLSPKYGFMGRSQGFAKLYVAGQKPGDFERDKKSYPNHMHPGYGWAWRPDAWAAAGGMFTAGVLGSGDHHMACGLVGYGQHAVWPGVHPGYADAALTWGERAFDALGGDIGFVEGLILHHFHGFKEHRGYKSRIDILREHQFDPSADLTFDVHGLPRLTPAKPRLRADIRGYMTSRREYDLSHALEN